MNITVALFSTDQPFLVKWSVLIIPPVVLQPIHNDLWEHSHFSDFPKMRKKYEKKLKVKQKQNLEHIL